MTTPVAIVRPEPIPVPFANVGRENTALLTPLLAATKRVLESGRVLYGAELEAFEQELAGWFGVKHAVGVASGTDAVEIALRACGVVGRRVAVGAFVAVPCINAIEAAGLEPVLFDADPVTRNANLAHTRDVMASLSVPLYGLPVDENDIPTVEDIAHSMGAVRDGQLVGTFGVAGAVSLYPSKILGVCGDGGAVITNDAAVAKRARKIRHYGFEDSGDINLRGQNSRLCELQAAYARVKLPHVNTWIRRRREIAHRYSAELAGRVTVPVEPKGCFHVYHCYVIEHDERERIIADAAARGVDIHRHYPKAIHEYGRWKHLGEPGEFPVAEKLARTVMSLPLTPFTTDREVERVIHVVKECT